MTNIPKDGQTLPAAQQKKEQVFEQYDVEITSLSKGRGTYIAETSNGKLLLKECKGSQERMRGLAELLKYLKTWDDKTEQLISNKEENYITYDEEHTGYLLKTYLPGRECDTRDADEILSGVKKLAELHKMLLQYPKDVSEMFRVKEHEFGNELNRHNRELNYVKNYIHKKKHKNEFEQLFWDLFSEYDTQAKQVHSKYVEFIKDYETEQVYGLCHGDCSQHNVVYYGTQARIINYEQLRFDMPISDLAKFMRKILEKNQWEVSLGMEMLNAYDCIRPLTYVEKCQLYYRLSYPERFWKIANHYHNSRKVWVSGRDIEKLQKMQTQEKQRKQFLEILFYLGR